MKYLFLAKRRGFTLVELIVVVGIIALLTSVVLFSISEVRSQARDKQRMTDLKQLELALALYKEAHGEYPMPSASCYEDDTNTSFSKWHGWADIAGDWATGYVAHCDKAAGEEYIEGLAPTFIPRLPEDPRWSFDHGDTGYKYSVADDRQSYKISVGWVETLHPDASHEFARCAEWCTNDRCDPDENDDYESWYHIWGGEDAACF